MNRLTLGAIVVWCVALSGCGTLPLAEKSPPSQSIPHTSVRPAQLSIVTTAVPFPRGLVVDGGKLYVLTRGRVRDVGGVDTAIIDHAGTIWTVDPDNTNTHANATPLAVPTAPPFKLLDRTLPTALDDHTTDRPYCGLRYDPATKQFFVCAFSGIDKPLNAPGGYFRKNTSDAVLAFDTRSGTWSERWRGAPLDGPDNCLVLGDKVLVVTKDNSKLLEFDTRNTLPPRELAGSKFDIAGRGVQEYTGHSMLATRGEYLYLGFRTSSTIIRVHLRDLKPSSTPVRAELVATFDPFDPVTRKSADLTDMSFGPDGDLYVVSARPARIYRFTPDPREVFDGRAGKSPAWADMFKLTNNPAMKCENVLVDAAGVVYVTSADLLPVHGSSGLAGVVYRVRP